MLIRLRQVPYSKFQFIYKEKYMIKNPHKPIFGFQSCFFFRQEPYSRTCLSLMSMSFGKYK